MLRFLLPAAALLTGLAATPVLAQAPTASGNRDQGRIAELARGAGTGDDAWRAVVGDFLRGEDTVSFGDRSAIADRGRELMRAVHDSCVRDGCGAGRGTAPPVADVARMAKGAACAAIPIDGVPVRNWTAPAGSLVFDFQPVGARPRPGAIPIVTGDARLRGGERGRRFSDRLPLTGDSLRDVQHFEAVNAPRGRVRVIVMGSARPDVDTADRAPFGASVVVNDQVIDVMPASPDRWLSRGALASGSPERTFAPDNVLPGRVPTIVFEVDNVRDALSLAFPSGAEIGAIVIEPADRQSSLLLDARARGQAVASPAKCLAEQEKIDRATMSLSGTTAATGGSRPTAQPGPREPAVAPVSRS